MYKRSSSVGNEAPLVKLNTSGNLTFTSTGQRILGDFNNATVSNRVGFKSSTAGATAIMAVANATYAAQQNATLNLYCQDDFTNGVLGQIVMVAGQDLRISSSAYGTGTYLPLTIYTGGSEALRIDTSRNLGLGTTAPRGKLHVEGAQVTGGAYQFVSTLAGYGTAFTTTDTIPVVSGQGVDGYNILTIRPSRWGTAGGTADHHSALYIAGCQRNAAVSGSLVFANWGYFTGTTTAAGGLGNATAQNDAVKFAIVHRNGTGEFDQSLLFNTKSASTITTTAFSIRSAGKTVFGTDTTQTSLNLVEVIGDTANQAALPGSATSQGSTLKITNKNGGALGVHSDLLFGVAQNAGGTATIGHAAISAYYDYWNAAYDIVTGLKFYTQASAAGGLINTMTHKPTATSLYHNGTTITHSFDYNENGGEISLYNNSGSQSLLVDTSTTNTSSRVLSLVNGHLMVVGCATTNTTGSTYIVGPSQADAIIINTSGTRIVKESYAEVTSNYTAVVGGGYLCNTSAGSFTLTLPASPSTGTIVKVIDVAGTFAAYPLTIGRNSTNIMGVAEDMICDISNSSFKLVYSGNATYGWRII